MYRYIIVDDEPLIRKGIRKKIRNIGLDHKLEFAGEAENGAEGMELIRKADPNIIITDMRMPVMDGKHFLKHAYEQYPDKKLIVLSGYSDFEYMKEAISAKVVGYILKPFNREEILTVLQEALRQIEADLMAVQQIVMKESETEELKTEADIQKLTNLLLGQHDKDKTPMLISNKMNMLKHANRYLLMTVYAVSPATNAADMNERCIALPHPNNKRIIFYIMFLTDSEAMNDYAVRQYTAPITRRILEDRPDAVIAVSSVKQSLIQLHEAYEETIATLNSRSELVSHAVTYFNGDHAPTCHLDWPFFDELLFFVESGNTDKTAEYVDKLFDFFESSAHITLSEIKNTCEYIVLEVRNILHEYFHTIGNQKASTSFGQLLETYFDSRSLRRYMSDALPGIAQLLSDHSDYSSQHVISNIQTYIHKNLNKTLSLEKVSSMFFLNPSYCSYLFKEKTGVNFVDYVNNARIQKAKEMLAATDEKVYRIAKSLGYDNTKYFFRLFKRITGLTPEEYRGRAKRNTIGL